MTIFDDNTFLKRTLRGGFREKQKSISSTNNTYVSRVCVDACMSFVGGWERKNNFSPLALAKWSCLFTCHSALYHASGEQVRSTPNINQYPTVEIPPCTEDNNKAMRHLRKLLTTSKQCTSTHFHDALIHATSE